MSTPSNPYDAPNDCAAWNAGESNERTQALDALIEACGGR